MAVLNAQTQADLTFPGQPSCTTTKDYCCNGGCSNPNISGFMAPMIAAPTRLHCWLFESANGNRNEQKHAAGVELGIISSVVKAYAQNNQLHQNTYVETLELRTRDQQQRKEITQPNKIGSKFVACVKANQQAHLLKGSTSFPQRFKTARLLQQRTAPLNPFIRKMGSNTSINNPFLIKALAASSQQRIATRVSQMKLPSPPTHTNSALPLTGTEFDFGRYYSASISNNCSTTQLHERPMCSCCYDSNTGQRLSKCGRIQTPMSLPFARPKWSDGS